MVMSPDPSVPITDPPGTVTGPSAGDLWNRALTYLPLYMDRRTFDHWFRGTRGLALEGDCLVVEARNARAVEWLEHRLAPIVDRALRTYLPGLHVRFVAPVPEPSTDPGTPNPELVAREPKRSPISGSPDHPIIVSQKKSTDPEPPTHPTCRKACPQRSGGNHPK